MGSFPIGFEYSEGPFSSGFYNIQEDQKEVSQSVELQQEKVDHPVVPRYQEIHASFKLLAIEEVFFQIKDQVLSLKKTFFAVLSRPSQTTKKVESFVSRIELTKIAEGAAKIVTTVPEDVPYLRDKAILLAKQFKQSELVEEYQTMRGIQESLPPDEEGAAFLATEAEKIPVQGAKFALLVDKASTNLEEAIRDPKLKLEQRLELCSQCLMALEALHAAGYSHGDLKPENFLVFKDSNGNLSVKLSDFGKTQQSEGIYKGNLRFAAPEVRQSSKSDVYGCALIIIRILEEQILTERGITSLFRPEVASSFDTSKKSPRRGIESFIVQDHRFLGREFKGMTGNIAALPVRLHLKLPAGELKQARLKATNFYIKALIERLKMPKESKDQLIRLLQRMTDLNPDSRIDMKRACKLFRYSAIISPPNIGA